MGVGQEHCKCKSPEKIVSSACSEEYQKDGVGVEQIKISLDSLVNHGR